MISEEDWSKKLVWATLGVLLVFAVYWEFNAVRRLNDRVKSVLAAVKQPDITTCDIVGNGAQLNDNAGSEIEVQWRRGIIASSILTIALIPMVGIEITSRQALIFVTLTWVVVTGMSGYSDYHMRQKAQNGVSDTLKSAMIKLSSSGDVCSPALSDTITSSA